MFKTIKSKESRQTATVTGSNLNNTCCEACGHFRNKNRQHLKDKINELEKEPARIRTRETCIMT
jgi:hypothetical protein